MVQLPIDRYRRGDGTLSEALPALLELNKRGRRGLRQIAILSYINQF
jgi:hypothetical protein